MTRTISEEAVIDWAKRTLEMLEKIHDPDRIIRKCKHCDVEVLDFVGRHSKKRLMRHPRGGCKPNGMWVVKDEQPK